MKTKSHKTLSALMLLTMLVMAVVQPAFASHAGYRTSQVQTSVPISGPTDPAEFEAFLDAYLAEQMEAYHIPGVAFTMVKDGEVFFSKGYGCANLETQTPIDPEQTVLVTASLAKVFAAVGVLQLNERGVIDLHEDVRPYFTEFPLKTNFDEPLTFANLLTHTDGFEARMIGVAAKSQDDLLPLGELLETYAPAQLYPPGQYMTYGDYASNLSGYLTQEISGVPFEQYMAENILLPLGMTSSTFVQPPPDELLERQIVPYEYLNGRQEPVEMYYTRYGPSGGLRTTAVDMSHFMLALLNGGEYAGARIMNEATIDLLFTQQFTPDPRMSGTTYELFEHFANGQRALLRDGDGVGTRSRMALFPEHNIGFFISYNSGEDGLRLDIVNAFIDHYFPAAGSSAPIPMDGYQQRASQFAGTYRPVQADATTFGKSMFLFSQLVDVSATEEGYLAITTIGFGDQYSVFGGFEGTSLWVEVEPLYFERVDGKGQLAFIQDEPGHVIQMVSGQGYHGTFEKLSWYEARTFQIVLIALAVLLMITILISTFVVWPLGALIRKLRKQSTQKPVSWGAVAARLWATLVAGMLVLFLFRGFGVLYGGTLPNFIWGLTPDMIESLNSMYLPAILALALPIFTIVAWVKGWWKTPTRVHYTLVTLAVLAGIWWAHYWNLLGFRM